MSNLIISGCAILRNNELLLVKKNNDNLWELPGGLFESKTNIEQLTIDAAKKQLGVEPQIVQQFTILEYQNNEQNVEETIFECALDEEAELVPGEDIAELKWFKMSDIKKEEVSEGVKSVLDDL
jgi:ADP-ribose pyrophosphatase YjhB (NUDIX family)